MTEKPRLVEVKDASEIEAVRRDGIDDPIGGQVHGTWYAYADSLEKYRKQIARATSSPSGPRT